MCQEAVRKLCNPSESCHVRKVARLLARPLRRWGIRPSLRVTISEVSLQSDVILLLPPLSGEAPQLLHQLGAEVRSAHRMLAQEVPKARGSEHLTLRVMRLY